ncbi:MAG: bifunctional 4-hydroxy-3-methylbut-2-enyl diphosphate reductase/30S ribosomal protein S1 [Clostridia bacterium]|nr:bifunctional 4-hydroxy-3-methylbut-2-enyl diphosphate reductase/30S ribosomal protein S1 [Clostridia bacterium]
MKIIRAKNLGFCYGVKRSLAMAQKEYPLPVYTYGELIHNKRIVDMLERRGIKAINNLSRINSGTIIIRSHGAPKEIIEEAKEKGLTIVDATCTFVERIRKIVSEKYSDGYKILIFGKKDHPEIIGINSLCDYSAIVIDSEELPELNFSDKVCLVAQTTASAEKFHNIINKIRKCSLKTVEIFDTICYTTMERQREAELLSQKCDKMLVIGDPKSSNTSKLKDICVRFSSTYLITNADELKSIKFNVGDNIGIVAGASAPTESITEVIQYMENNYTEAQNEEFLQAVDAVGTNGKLKDGKRMKVKVTAADEKGITVNFGVKIDGYISADEADLNDAYNPDNYKPGDELDVILLSAKAEDGLYRFSKKKVDKIKEGDKIVDTIRNGEIFELVVDRETKGGLIGKLGTYTVFVPASQIKEKYIHDLKPFIGKTLRLTQLEIDDSKRRIVASQKVILERERKEREEIFWANVIPGVIVNGKVKGISKFGAFVSVDGYDCLVHISDVSWTKFRSIDDVIHTGKKYDFVVLKADREKGKVSLGYKQLQKHPFELAMENHPVGSEFVGKVTSIMPFGAFVEVEPGVEGLVHVSEASNVYVKNINDVFKVGDEVKVKVFAIDPDEKKITLSAKACMPAPTEEEKAVKAEKKESKPRAPKKREIVKEDDSEWSDEDTGNNPFAELLKDLKD